ncbi:MAG TPA: cupin domain-containing protein, partial [Verrucomicrobiae bacterium]|nr:cupin domain-containing protein [Verrucomicrobiae bacterium]
AAGPKRLLLGQGELANFYNGHPGICYLALLELKPGSVRGNHVHRVKLEHVYLISGRLKVIASAESDADSVSFEVNPGELVTIEAGIAHAFKTIEGGYAIEFSPMLFDGSDVEKRNLI